ncbi:ankyrin repeat domain-containing protein [Moheibacter stercoris]|uniref:Ankyrin repeat protein n=1 Tax=Moheibacter stercoris TaxID=1628251 RepID=A0ABV2LUY2_9FLAO
MKRISVIKASLLSLSMFSMSLFGQNNSMLNGEFWKQNPSIEIIKGEIAKGNSPSEANRGNHDVASMAINNNASLESILFLLKQEGNPLDKVTHDGRYYIHWAASKGNVELVNYLIQNGSTIDRTDDKGATPLAFAAGNGQLNPAVYELFFKAGIDPKQKYYNGANLLLLAIGADKDLKFSDYLQSKGLSLKDTDDLGRTTFDYAARNGNLDVLKKLVQKGVQPTGHALIFASQGTRSHANGLDVYQYLVETMKLDPKSQGETGENVLFNLVRKKEQEAIISYFLEKGVDVNAVDNNGTSAFMMASSTKNLELVKSLVSSVKDINQVNKNGESALFFAVQSSSPEMIQFLIDQGAKTNLVGKDGNLAAYLVQSYRAPRPNENNQEFLQKLELLKTNGVDFVSAQKNGSTLLHLAIAKNDVNLFKALENLGININAQDEDGMTVLHRAAMMAKDDSILNYLIGLGADKTILTEFDELAHDLAMENEFLKDNNTNLDFLK